MALTAPFQSLKEVPVDGFLQLDGGADAQVEMQWRIFTYFAAVEAGTEVMVCRSNALDSLQLCHFSVA